MASANANRRPDPDVRYWEQNGSGGPTSGAVSRCHRHWNAAVDLRRRAGPAGSNACVPGSGRSVIWRIAERV